VTNAPARPRTAGQLLDARLRDQVQALFEADRSIRAGNDAGVHEARVACRRLRAALATFRPVVRVEVSEPLRDQLRWLAQSLGEARDLHVARERLLGLADQEGEAAVALVERIRSEDSAHDDDAQVQRVLASQRYADLLDALEDLVADPPWTGQAERDARSFLRRRIDKEWRRLEDRVVPVEGLDPGTAPDQQLHDVRKAAKRLRYALEVAEPLWRKKAKRLRTQVHRLTDTLGERQDTVVTRAILLHLAAQAEAAGDPEFTHGRLHQSEESRATELEGQFHAQWSAIMRLRSRWP
jgi:CHAD domain-containing protein